MSVSLSEGRVQPHNETTRRGRLDAGRTSTAVSDDAAPTATGCKWCAERCWQAVADSLGAREAGKVSGSGLHTTAPSAPSVRLGFAAVCSAMQAKQAVGAVIA